MVTMADRAPGRVERAVRAELRELGFSVQTDGAAALAVALAEQIDHARGAVAAAAAAAQLRMLLADLDDAAKRRPKVTKLDSIRGLARKDGRSASAS